MCPIGNSNTLKADPAGKGIDVHHRLVEFRKYMYSAHYMTLAVQSRGKSRDDHDLRWEPFILYKMVDYVTKRVLLDIHHRLVEFR